jgi:hypothetical protein
LHGQQQYLRRVLADSMEECQSPILQRNRRGANAALAASLNTSAL